MQKEVNKKEENPLFKRIQEDINLHAVVLYMKGTPMFPQCGFSATAVDILSKLGIKFKGIDILADPMLRDSLKKFTNWPTFPQLYVKGEFIGGSDIMKEMYHSGELKRLVENKGIKSNVS